MRVTREFELPLSMMQEEIARADLLPKDYAQYRPLVADGLRFFLERLASRRLRAIMAEQMELPRSTSAAERLVAVLHHAPALHKLGQVLARDRRLKPAFRRRLQELESLEPRTSAAVVARVLEREVKDWRRAGIRLGDHALAEGSVAVVVPFVWELRVRGWRNRTGRTSQPSRTGEMVGVFKVLKPGVEAELEEDREVLGALGVFLEQTCERYHLPALEYRETFETICELLLHEVRLEEEQQHLAEAETMYSDMPAVVVPALFPFCTRRVTAMERVFGVKLTSGAGDGAARLALARTTVEALITRPMFSRNPAALFHADPHAGNLVAMTDGRLGILDWSLTGRLRKQARIEMVQLLLAGFALDLERMEVAVRALADKAPTGPMVREVLEESLRELRRRQFPGLVWLTELLDNLVLRVGVRLSGDLLLFRKVLLTLEGVLADVTRSEAQAILDESVLAGFLRQWTLEWPERFVKPLTERAFGTHLSTADVLGLWCTSPWTMAKWLIH